MNAASNRRVAVLINNYNNGPWLRACVDSALAQSRPPDEVVVYDDGSTDDSVEILRSYGDRIRLIEGVHQHSRHGFASQFAAVCAAFAASTADHLYLLDGDDLFLPGKILRYEAAWSGRPELVLVQAPMLRIDPKGAPLREEREPRKQIADPLAATYAAQDPDFHYWTSALAFRRDPLARLLELCEPITPALALDSALAGVAPLLGPVATLEPALTAWRRHPRSQSLNQTAGRLANLRARQTHFNRVAARLEARPLRAWRSPVLHRELARAAGLNAYILSDELEGESREVGKVHAALARAAARGQGPFVKPCVILSGGETTVTVRPVAPGSARGRGGRAGEFCLGLALGLQGQAGVWGLAADTDGIDGMEENAGAQVTPDTLQRALAQGLKASDAMDRNDAYGFFQPLGDLVVTGPTFTNVNDFRALLVL